MHAKTVLIVEDEEDSRLICATLLRHHGYQVVEATDGEEGVQLAREQRPDLVIIDLMLPKLDGWTAIERLKKDPGTADIPIIALTVRAAEVDQEKARAAGVDSYLIKPCEPRRILEEVTRFIGPASAAAES